MPFITVIVDNGLYGTIRMHQEREYPGRPVATDLRNPDFAAYARSFGGAGFTVEKTADFPEAFKAAAGLGPAGDHPSEDRPECDHAGGHARPDPRTLPRGQV